jgi:uncharacterized protein (TIGR02246 family)
MIETPAEGHYQMKPHSLGKALACVVLLAFLSGCSGPCETETSGSLDRNADESAIRSLIAANAAASTAGDAAGVAATYSTDGDVWIAGLSRVSTHDGISSVEEDFQGLPGFQSWDVTIENIRFISRDAAIVEESATTTLDTGSFDEESTIVVVRSEDGWKIAAARVMNFDETLLNLLRN